MYSNILNLIKDQDDNKTSHDIIGSIITGQAIYSASSEIDIQKQNSEKKHSSKWLK